MADKIKPSEAFDVRGWWWRPESKDQVAPGRLAAEPGSLCSLDLDAKLPEAQESGTHPVLWGHVDGTAERVTLLRTFYLGTYGVNDNTGTHSLVKWTLFGDHVDAIAEKAVAGLRVRWQCSDDWFDETLAPHAEWWNGEPIETKKLEPVLHAIPIPGATFEIVLKAHVGGRSAGHVEMWHELWWEVTFDAPRTLDDVGEHTRALRDFMWLAAGQPVAATSIQVRLADTNPERPRWLSLVGSLCYGHATDERVHGHFMALPYPAIKQEFDTILPAWLKLRMETNKGAFSQWSLVLADEREPLERQLAVRTQFLDAILPDVPLMARAKFLRVAEQVCAAIPANEPGPVRDAIARRVKEANRGTLRDRFTAARNSLPPDVVQKYGFNDDMLRAAGQVRNDLAHGGTLGKIEFAEAVMLSAKLRLFCLANLLTAIGLPSNRLVERIDKCMRWALPRSVETF